jgi:hypothetical protein
VDRRAFIAGMTCDRLAAPLAAKAQPARVARIGYLSLVSASADAANVDAFPQGGARG